MNDDGFISTSRLAKELHLPMANVFEQLRKKGLIQKAGDKDELTEEGKRRGGRYMSSPQYGTWIAWPKDIIKVASGEPGQEPKMFNEVVKESYQNATALGRVFDIPANRMNYVLSELGWIQKSVKGWRVTPQGLAVGGTQREDLRSGIPFVLWPEAIIKNSTLLNTIHDIQGTSIPVQAEESSAVITESKGNGFRDRFPAKFRATDGHFVRSRSEMLIDNWLYMAEIVHAYERKLPIEEEAYCDFYLPEGKVYIEYWGMEEDPKYAERMKVKRAIYARQGFNLIDLHDADVQNLDDILPAKLLKFGVQAY
jgi:hypothetical protein